MRSRLPRSPSHSEGPSGREAGEVRCADLTARQRRGRLLGPAGQQWADAFDEKFKLLDEGILKCRRSD